MPLRGRKAQRPKGGRGIPQNLLARRLQPYKLVSQACLSWHDWPGSSVLTGLRQGSRTSSRICGHTACNRPASAMTGTLVGPVLRGRKGQQGRTDEELGEGCSLGGLQ